MREIVQKKIVQALAAEVPAFTRRDVHVPGIRGKAIAVIGMRRTGKTTFLWQLLADRLAAGAPRESLLYFNFEDEKLAGMTAADLTLVVDGLYELHPGLRGQQRVLLLLDEIQLVPGWERFARSLLDTEKVELFLSGSSARLLSREVATSMRGRGMEALVHPFSFREYLRHLGREPGQPPLHLPPAAESQMASDLRLYLANGGFPESLGAVVRDRRDLLRNLVDVALLRDVVERHNVSHPVALRWMARHLLANAAGKFSISKLYFDLRSQDVAVAKDTLHAYLAHLEDAFLIRTVSLATDSERRRMVNPRKVYPVDPGLIPLFDRSGKPNTGHALETAVMVELERRGADIGYVRTSEGLEVDFLARDPEGRLQLIQVAADLDSASTREREVRGLLAAAADHPRATLHLVTLTPETARGIPEKVAVHSAAVWLLEGSEE